MPEGARGKENTVKARSMIVMLALLASAMACVHAAPAARQATEEYLFMGYRLVVQTDYVGIPISAQAFDPQGKQVSTVLVPLRDVSVCYPKPPGATTGTGQTCLPFSFLPEKTLWKAGTGSICSLYSGGQLIYYPC